MIGTATDEALLLDLLNSTPVVDGHRQDLLAGPDAAAWLRDRGGDGSAAERRQAVTARGLLQDVVRGDRPAEALAPLLHGVRSVPLVTASGLTWRTDVTPTRRLAVRAVLAWDEVQVAGPGRLRACANPECTLFLIDHSKPNRARWCSMAACGNRMKARRHYERTRAAR